MGRFKRIQQITALLTCLLFTSTAHAADDFYKYADLPLRLIPEYVPCIFEGREFACFTRDQTIELFTLEVQAKYWHANWREKLSVLDEKNIQIDNLNERLKLYDNITVEDNKFIDDLMKDFVKTTKDRNEWRAKAENPPKWPLWVGVTAFTLGAGAFISSLVR